MAKQKQETKLRDLKERYKFTGENTEFFELLSWVISKLPEPYRSAMHRHYILDEEPVVDPATKKRVGADIYYYTNIQIGREILDTVFSFGISDLSALIELRTTGKVDTDASINVAVG
jgi:hypothetical protein